MNYWEPDESGHSESIRYVLYFPSISGDSLVIYPNGNVEGLSMTFCNAHSIQEEIKSDKSKLLLTFTTDDFGIHYGSLIYGMEGSGFEAWWHFEHVSSDIGNVETYNKCKYKS